MDNKTEKTFTEAEVVTIIERAISEAMINKNKYIEMYGYKNKDILNRFDTSISTLSTLYHYFEI